MKSAYNLFSYNTIKELKKLLKNSRDSILKKIEDFIVFAKDYSINKLREEESDIDKAYRNGEISAYDEVICKICEFKEGKEFD